MISCVIIDDEQYNITLLKKYIARLPYMEVVHENNNPEKGLAYVIEHDPDVIFLDIQMEEMSGIDVAAAVPDATKVIFTTASSEYPFKAFELGVKDYLVKPFSFERFMNAVNKVAQPELPTTAPKSTAFWVRGENKGRQMKIRPEEICYVDSSHNYVGIHPIEGAMITSLMTLKELEQELTPPQFMRIHKSYIVALDAVTGIDGNELIIKVGDKEKRLTIGPSYKEAFMATMRSAGK